MCLHRAHITTGPTKKSVSIFPLSVSPQPSLLQAEQPQLSQTGPIGEVFQPSDHLRGPPLDPLQQVHVLLVLGAPDLDAGLQVGSHQGGVEWQNHLPCPAAKLLLVQPRILLAFWAASTRWWCMSSFSSTSTPHPSRQGCSQSLHPPACIHTRSCPEPDGGPCTWPC